MAEREARATGLDFNGEASGAAAYQELERIGHGAEGSVYRVKHLESGRFMALKKIFTQNLRQRPGQDHAHEAKILASLDHPHIVRFHESFMDAQLEYLCIVQDWCDGGNLQQRIAGANACGEPFGEGVIMGWFVQMVLASILCIGLDLIGWCQPIWMVLNSLTQYPLTQYRLTQYPLTQYPLTQYPLTQYPLAQYPLTQYPLTQYPLPAYAPLCLQAGPVPFALYLI